MADRGAGKGRADADASRAPRGATRATAVVRDIVGIVASAFIAARSAMRLPRSLGQCFEVLGHRKMIHATG